MKTKQQKLTPFGKKVRKRLIDIGMTQAPYDFQELHEKRQAVRNEIDALEAELKIAPISEEEIA